MWSSWSNGVIRLCTTNAKLTTVVALILIHGVQELEEPRNTGNLQRMKYMRENQGFCQDIGAQNQEIPLCSLVDEICIFIGDLYNQDFNGLDN